MAEFLAITFDTADEAEAALQSVRALQSGGQIGLEDTAVVRKDADGKVTIHNEASTGTETGAVVGAVLGGLLFVIFPVAGIVGGAVAGGLIGTGRGARPRRQVRQGGRRRPAGRRLGPVPPDQERRQSRAPDRCDAPVPRAGSPDVAAGRGRDRAGRVAPLSPAAPASVALAIRAQAGGARDVSGAPSRGLPDGRPDVASRIIGVPWPTDRATTSRPRSPTPTTSPVSTRSTR